MVCQQILPAVPADGAQNTIAQYKIMRISQRPFFCRFFICMHPVVPVALQMDRQQREIMLALLSALPSLPDQLVQRVISEERGGFCEYCRYACFQQLFQGAAHISAVLPAFLHAAVRILPDAKKERCPGRVQPGNGILNAFFRRSGTRIG